MTEEMIGELKQTCHRIEEILYLLMYKERESILNTAVEVFGTSSRRVEIYLMLDGKISATEIAAKLDMKRPNVSIEIGILYNSGLIEQVEAKQGSPYQRRLAFELIGLPAIIKERFNL
ncbi:MAG: winged helix-turn-helix domain-containing protein [Candidatus Thorarchaeota archaeon]|nr:winged helix-turn-helix domain-containing protein [Candidatus Thorarchaeota archaeon]